MDPHFFAFVILLCLTSELNINTALTQNPPDLSTTELYPPGKSIHLPRSGVGTWREISLSRRSNAQRDGRSLTASSAASRTVLSFRPQHCNSAAWVLSLPNIWIAMNY